MLLRHCLTFALLALLAGCAGLGPKEAVQGQGTPQAWRDHKTQTALVDGWEITGKVGIRAPSDSGSGTLYWLQRQGYYDIRLSGPLGRGAARLTGHAGDATLEVANQGRFQAASPEDLLEQQLGWRLPVGNLVYWVRGLPAPEGKSTVVLDADSHLARLEQAGWTIEYTRYSQQGNYWLPERMKLHGQDLDVTLVIKDWQPRQLGH